MNSKGLFHDARIIVFTRFPLPGQAKTRLIPSLGADGAAGLQRRMTEFTVAQVLRTGIQMEIRFTGATDSRMREWLGPEGYYTPQGEGDLGERMNRAFEDAFRNGAKKALIIGCDCPDNRSSNIMTAFRQLEDTSCVIGPAADGGYYLIGLNAPRPDLFRDIDWGTKSVFRQTVEKFNDYALLPVLSDVDETQDVPPGISVIIPALNEESCVGATVESVLKGFNTEAIVVDGGSIDKTGEAARKAGAGLFSTGPGRALQMNFGAKQATGDILLFLHADSALPPEWDCHVRQVMKQPGTRLGHFAFAISGPFPGRRWVEFGTNMRARLLKRPYGDQGLFLRREEFFELGGYPEVPILEDVFLVKQAKKQGRVRCANAGLATSGRRWMKYGVIRTTLVNQAVLVAAFLGADLYKLRNAYRTGMIPVSALMKKVRHKGSTA